jgi:hypothetical protein
MTDYCSLHIRSDVHSALPENFLRDPNAVEIVFTDNESPERRASFERLRRKGVFKRAGLPRYHWTFSSEGHVEGFDVYEHLAWVLNQVHPDCLLSKLQSAGFECLLQFFWVGNGTGGGPLVTPQIAELLARHGVGLQFGFYVQSEDA